ncbi:adenylate cyclase [Enterovibrio norvegicus]|uniref:Adenylate cyclase n=1 Tax=Enterovibrio norvegicus DSM 15893 TaxID=1121869 RepID=A0A1I5RW96_9GAMM|nr:class I adenylate cyclase [Enterovibrio norvegicus]MCC4797490.1 class I adenylate cyclase [Enterovibrio norvegicus]PMH64687.1 adenylate cyclase [Enterovibrio norvegicus]PMI32846.1 adenylate cyclase [Enterovibrio norvegicus]PMI41700.1 adenylate cyclase [Enterovibrio norvegicus]PMN52511.1 adenylate cyclase [Enterovibrio norvegicus]
MFILQNYVDQQIERLDAFNQVRLERARSAMHSQAINVFNVLPVLLHFNHPAIPGYLERSVVHGISSFTLSDLQRDFVNDCALAVDSAIPDKPLSDEFPIKGLFSMGSTASMGQSLSSDLDIWVCVQQWVSEDQRAMLDSKCSMISDWAMAQGVEVNFFVMCEQRFRKNLAQAMTSDNCGSSQHYLLLDEFYRSALHLAGQQLLWYLVPPEMEDCYEEYVGEMIASGAICRDDWVDFGGLPSIPAEEYFGSSLWQLYKSIDSPYKSVLKAILLEAYSWEYPGTQLLSVDGKRRFYSGMLDVYQSDAYYLMLEKVTRYLERIDDHRRLDLVRRCFYLKTHEKLTREPGPGSVPWRREVLCVLTREWGWSQDDVARLDNRRNWKVEEVKEAHNELLEALMLSYRNLIRFARRNDITSAISPEDISILARKLYAAFEVLPGKVTLLNPQLSPDLHEPNLTLIQVPEGRSNPPGWYLYKQSLKPVDIIGRSPLEHNRYLSKLVAWAYFNGMLTESTCLHSVARNSNVDIDKLYQLVSDMRNTFSVRRPQPSLQALSSPCEIRKLALFINLEQDPTSELKQPAVRFDFKNTDIFSYGPEQECLVGSVDLVYRNSWNEVRTLNFKGANAMLDVLKTLLGKMHQDAIPPESVDVFCYAGKMRGLIRNLVYQLVAECIDMRLKPVDQEKRRRFKAIRVADQTFGLFFERRGVSVQKLENSVDFYRSISTNKINGSPVVVLDKDGEVHPPEVVDAYASEGLIQFFFEDCEQGFNIYVLDENNRVEVYRQFSGDKDEMVQGVNRFYTSSQDKVSFTGQAVNFNLPQFYDIIHHADGRAQVIPYKSGPWQRSAEANAETSQYASR